MVLKFNKLFESNSGFVQAKNDASIFKGVMMGVLMGNRVFILLSMPFLTFCLGYQFNQMWFFLKLGGTVESNGLLIIRCHN